MAHQRHCARLLSECSVSHEDHDDSMASMNTEEQAIELIKESLAAATDGETDSDFSVTHAFIILGASVFMLVHLLVK